jgi:hypothetical protein
MGRALDSTDEIVLILASRPARGLPRSSPEGKSMPTLGFLFGAALLLPVAGPAAPSTQPAQVNATGAAVLAFRNRVADYVKVHEQAESKVPKLTETSDPAKVDGREKALGRMITQLRAGAREGDVFGADFRPILEREIRADFKARSAADRKALVHELPAKMTLAVNMTYPTDLPLATFPARLLNRLPELPPQLEYRIVGRHLVLRDAKANVIVDIARDIVPTIPS